MIHPSEILRTNSDQASQFSAPVNTNRKNVDCGIMSWPWLAEKLNLQRFATAEIFVTVFAFIGLLEGALLSYFRGTSHIWTQHYYLGEVTLDWLIHLNEILVGVFAIALTYWGNRIHRASWFGGLVMLQAVASIILVIPEVYEPHVDTMANSTGVSNLCVRTILTNMTQLRESNWVALGILVVFQLFFALSSIAFYTLGVTYLDDNIDKENSPIYLIIPLAAKIFGKQLGMYFSWVPILFDSARVFVSAMWLVLSSIIFILGFIIVLFPHSLPSMVVQRAVASLLNSASHNTLNTRSSEYTDDEDYDDDDEEERPKRHGFLPTFLRIIKNPILVVNSIAMVFMAIALVNFEIYQNIFFQLRFFVNVGRDLSGYNEPFLAQIIMNIIKYPFIAISLVVTGLIVAKSRPSAKYLAVFNVGFYITAALLYVSFVFTRCDTKLHTEFDNTLTIPYCSSNCICKNIPFTPVCTTQANVTYFSPCHAGCKTSDSIRGIQIYGNCTCGANIYQITDATAVDGSCQKETCGLYWAFAQISSVMASSVLAATTVTNLLINIRCVEPSDKAFALGFETTLVGILPFIPGKLVYSFVADSMCVARGDERCLLHSESFGLFFSVITVVLMAIAAILAMFVAYLIGNLNLYGEDNKRTDDVRLEPIEDPDIEEYNTVRQNSNVDPPREESRRLANNNNDFDDDDANLDFTLRTGDNQRSTNADVHDESNRKKQSNPELLESDF